MGFYIRYPSSSGGSGSNASVGTNGATAPTSSTEVAGVNPSGILQPLQTNASGALITTPDPAGVQHVIVDSSALPTGAATQTTLGTVSTTLGSILLDMTNGTQITQITGTVPLPTGASTSALQTSGNASLTSIDSKTPALGQQLAAASQPVVLTAAQLTTLTPLTSVIATQATGTNLHTVVDSGSVTANAGTNLNTSALALDATLTGGTARAKITDGTNNAAVKAASTPAAATDPALVVAISPNNSIVAGTPSGSLTDRSGTCSATPLAATTLAAINASRKYLFIENNSTAGDIYISFTSSATALNSVVLKPFASYEMNGNFVSTELISVASNVASATFSAKEG